MMSALLSPALTPTGLIKKKRSREVYPTDRDERAARLGGFIAELKEGRKKSATTYFLRVAHCVGELLLVGNVDDGGILKDWQAEQDTSYFIQLWTCSWFSPSTVSHSTISLVHSHSRFAYFSSFPLRLTIYWVFPLFLNCLHRKMFPLSGN